MLRLSLLCLRPQRLSDGHRLADVLTQVRRIEGSRVRRARQSRRHTNEAHKLQYVSAYVEAQSQAMEEQRRRAALSQASAGHSPLVPAGHLHSLPASSSSYLYKSNNVISSSSDYDNSSNTSSVPFGAWRCSEPHVLARYHAVDARVHTELHEATTPAHLSKQTLHRVVHTWAMHCPQVRALMRHVKRVCAISDSPRMRAALCETEAGAAGSVHNVRRPSESDKTRLVRHFVHVMRQQHDRDDACAIVVDVHTGVAIRAKSKDDQQASKARSVSPLLLHKADDGHAGAELRVSRRSCLTSWCIMCMVEAGGWSWGCALLFCHLHRVLPLWYALDCVDDNKAASISARDQVAKLVDRDVGPCGAYTRAIQEGHVSRIETSSDVCSTRASASSHSACGGPSFNAALECAPFIAHRHEFNQRVASSERESAKSRLHARAYGPTCVDPVARRALLHEARCDVSQQIAVLAEAVRFAHPSPCCAPTWQEVTAVYHRAIGALTALFCYPSACGLDEESVKGGEDGVVHAMQRAYSRRVQLLPVVAAPLLSLYIPPHASVRAEGHGANAECVQKERVRRLASHRAQLRRFVLVHLIHYTRHTQAIQTSFSTHDPSTAQPISSSSLTDDAAKINETATEGVAMSRTDTATASSSLDANNKSRRSASHKRRSLPAMAWAAYLHALFRAGADLTEIQRELDDITDDCLTDAARELLHSVHLWNAYLSCLYADTHPHELHHASATQNSHTNLPDRMRTQTTTTDLTAATGAVGTEDTTHKATCAGTPRSASKGCAQTTSELWTLYHVHMKQHYRVRPDARTVAAVMTSTMRLLSSSSSLFSSSLSLATRTTQSTDRFASPGNSQKSMARDSPTSEFDSALNNNNTDKNSTPNNVWKTPLSVWCALRGDACVADSAGFATASLCVAYVNMQYQRGALCEVLHIAVNYRDFWLYYGLSRSWFDAAGGEALARQLRSCTSFLSSSSSPVCDESALNHRRCEPWVRFFHEACARCVHAVPPVIQHTWCDAVTGLCRRSVRARDGGVREVCESGALAVCGGGTEDKNEELVRRHHVLLTAEDLAMMM